MIIGKAKTNRIKLIATYCNSRPLAAVNTAPTFLPTSSDFSFASNNIAIITKDQAKDKSRPYSPTIPWLLSTFNTEEGMATTNTIFVNKLKLARHSLMVAPKTALILSLLAFFAMAFFLGMN